MFLPTSTSLLLCSFTLILLLTLLPQRGYSYCIYNHADTDFYIEQQLGQSNDILHSSAFKHNAINPGNKQCYPYGNKDCSKVSNIDHHVTFWDLQFHGNEGSNLGYGITCLVGGYVIVGGTGIQPKFECFDANHNTVNTTDVRQREKYNHPAN
ncbi:hypothetical protein BDA99DRAFT_539575 [Phascolomyces articulosus]|uniref:Uncharacterized protein n=1 Tax=Phascolomyces articulosus TaxID=60185 RepID=A0AAD5K8U8_9FUNG|nr:hypothetical protein BDA99DRAFT_539575 [Phascolomyces articulosus]